MDRHELRARHHVEELAGQVGGGADACARVEQGAGLRLGECNQLGHALHAERGMHDQYVRGLGERRHRDQAVADLVAHVVHQRLVDGVAQRRVEKRVAIGRGGSCRLDGDRPARSGLVLDHELLPQDLPEPGADQPRDDVRGATRRKSDHDPHRPHWVVLGMRHCGTCHCGDADDYCCGNPMNAANRYSASKPRWMPHGRNLPMNILVGARLCCGASADASMKLPRRPIERERWLALPGCAQELGERFVPVGTQGHADRDQDGGSGGAVPADRRRHQGAGEGRLARQAQQSAGLDGSQHDHSPGVIGSGGSAGSL